MEWTLLPLYEDWDYEYTTVLEEVSYTIKMSYSDRTQQWTMSVSLEQGDVIADGIVIGVRDAVYLKGQEFLSGVFWMEPKGISTDISKLHPSLINKYFNFYYGWGEVEEFVREVPLVRNDTTRMFSITSSLYPLYVEESMGVGRNFSEISIRDKLFYDEEEKFLLGRGIDLVALQGPLRDWITDDFKLNRSIDGVTNTTILKSYYEDHFKFSRGMDNIKIITLIKYGVDEDDFKFSRGLDKVEYTVK